MKPHASMDAIPVAMPGIVAATIFAFTAAWGQFLVSDRLTGCRVSGRFGR
jgi:ABC-type spermidine/putrescine transport system permease subunit I